MSTTVTLTLKVTLAGSRPLRGQLQQALDDIETVMLEHLQTPLGEVQAAEARAESFHWASADTQQEPT